MEHLLAAKSRQGTASKNLTKNVSNKVVSIYFKVIQKKGGIS